MNMKQSWMLLMRVFELSCGKRVDLLRLLNLQQTHGLQGKSAPRHALSSIVVFCKDNSIMYTLMSLNCSLYLRHPLTAAVSIRS